MIREHEFPIGVPSVSARCIHCGGLWQPTIEATCIDRVGDTPRPSGRRVLACEDSDAIAARIAELRAERAAAMTAADPEPQMDPGDCCG